MDLHLHKLQSSARVIGRGCDAHNRRFATVSCEPVTLGNGSHAHQVTFRADSCEGHVHYLAGITGEQNGHRHSFKFITNIEDPIGD